MARIEFDEYKVKLENMEPKLTALGESLGLESAREELERLHAMAASEGFWNDAANSQKVTKQTRLLETKIASFEKMCADREDMLVLCEMAIEEDDDSMLPELEEGYAALEQEMEEARLETLLTGEYDGNNALMSFHAGAGGTEAQDWCQMLYRMYTRWAERHGFTYKIMDYLEGDEAGLKSADILIEGTNAYGFLKGENASTVWFACLPLTPTPAVRPPLPPLRLSPRSMTMPMMWRFVPRISRCRCTVPPAQAASTSTRPPPRFD